MRWMMLRKSACIILSKGRSHPCTFHPPSPVPSSSPHVSSRAPSPRENHRHIRLCLSPLRLSRCPSHLPPRFASFVTLPTSPSTMPSKPVTISPSGLTSNSVRSPSCVRPPSTQTRASIAMPISPKSLARNRQRQSGKLHSIWPNGLA